MAKTAVISQTPTHEEISAKAYEIYLREGSQPGRDIDNWLKAEAELRERSLGSNGNGNGSPKSNGNGASKAAAPQISSAAITNSVLPASTPIAQVTRTTTPRRAPKQALAAK
jgi:hypothetical protein